MGASLSLSLSYWEIMNLFVIIKYKISINFFYSFIVMQLPELVAVEVIGGPKIPFHLVMFFAELSINLVPSKVTFNVLE